MSEERSFWPGGIERFVGTALFAAACWTIVSAGCAVRRIADAQERAHPKPSAEAGK